MRHFSGSIMAAFAVSPAGALVLMSPWWALNFAGAATQRIEVDARPLSREAKNASYASIVRKVAPSVVNVTSTKSIRLPPFSRQLDPLLQRFFGDQFDQGSGPPQTRKTEGLGSGVIVTEDGYLLTNNHVVEGADKVEVTLADGKTTYPAKVVGADSLTDVALLKVEAKRNLPSITLADSEKLEVGDLVLAIGNPFGVGQTVTSGIVSAVGRGGFGVADYEDFIQTDAAINPGNSGGALVDAEGRLIGINTWIVSESGGSAGVGFAIPVNLAKGVLDRLVAGGTVTRGFLGVHLQPEDLTPNLAKEFSLPEQSGALVTEVDANSPAALAGAKQADVIVEFNGKKVVDNRHLRLMVSQTPPKSKITLKVIRNGQPMNLAVTLGELSPAVPRASARPPEQVVETKTDTLGGVELKDLTARLRRQYEVPMNVKGALVTSVEGGSPAEDGGLRPGDVILEIKGKPVESADEARAANQKATGERVLMRLWSSGSGSSSGGPRYVVIENPKPK